MQARVAAEAIFKHYDSDGNQVLDKDEVMSFLS